RDDDVAPEDLEFEPAFEFSDEDQYEIAVQCVDVDEGVQLAMWVDGDLVLSAVDDDDPLESGVGAVGVVNSSLFADGEFTPYGAAFDDFEFVTPDGAPVGGSGDEDETETETEEETEIEGGTSGEAGSVAVGDQIAADPLATPGALGFPTSGEGLALTYDEGGLFLKLEGEGTAYAFPVASAVQAPTDGVAVGADVVGLAVSIGYEDYWGLTCNVNKETGEFYAFVGQGDIEVDDAYTVSIVRHDEEGFEFLAQETVENGGSRFAMGAACVPTEDGAMHLEMSFGDERVLAHVDEDPLPAGQVGVFLNSESGSSGTSFGNFVVHEASLG
ncbi:MAG TPA: hypothetical protein VHK88_14455, partial [Aquihabitans sp.]|nr:hypothetical protein [Aquihabitans sp.]